MFWVLARWSLTKSYARQVLCESSQVYASNVSRILIITHIYVSIWVEYLQNLNSSNNASNINNMSKYLLLLTYAMQVFTRIICSTHNIQTIEILCQKNIKYIVKNSQCIESGYSDVEYFHLVLGAWAHKRYTTLQTVFVCVSTRLSKSTEECQLGDKEKNNFKY